MKEKIYETLKNVFGYDSFRPLQEEIITRTLAGKDSFVLMPTGGGKSVCFQIPAILLNGITIVVSPLISLMKDQVQALKANGIKADFFNSSITPAEEERVINNALKGKLKLLYLSPEKLISVSQTLLKSLDISLVAVDEAHCVSMWGHDFRPEYTQLKTFRNSLPNVPFMALTATADKSARQDIENQLGLKKSKLFISSFDRQNLSINVRGMVPKQQKLQEINRFIKSKNGAGGIIYCLSRKNTEEVSGFLKESGFSVAHYHAGMDPENRERIQTQFINDEIKIIVATIAFGMGIDKPNVRWVIHYNLPKNLEGYYQEIGRAGRDGLPSETVLYYNMRDFVLYSQFADGGANSEIQKEKLARMLQFAEAKSCRRRILLSYFGEHLTRDCGNCDVCANPPVNFDGTIIAQKGLSAIVRLKEKEGIKMVVNVLRGSQNAEIYAKGYEKIKTFGIAKEISFFDWRDYIIQLANQGAVEIMYNENSSLKMTPIGWEIVKGQRTLQLTKPVQLSDKKKLQKSKPLAKTSLIVFNDDLFKELKQLRQNIAKEENVPSYIVFGDKTLKEMATLMPVNDDQFLAISGVGMNKMEQFGDEFMEVIRRYKSRPKPKKKPTTLVTLDLYNEGLTPEEIAHQRGLQLVTIYSHLSQLFLDGKAVDIAQYVSSEIVAKVNQCFIENDKNTALKPIFEALDETIPYHQIRLALTLIMSE